MFPPPPPPEQPPQPPSLSVAARQLSLRKRGPPPPITSFLYDPASLSLALSHSDSSFSLHPSLSSSPVSLSSLPPPQTLIPPPSSSATFFHLKTAAAASSATSVFLISSPALGGSAVLLRFYLHRPATKSFSKARIACNHRDLSFDESSCGVVFRVSHGVSVRLVGSTSVFAMYSVSNARVWVFAVRLVEKEVLKLMKCAVIDCVLPIFSISVSFGYLILGEERGVRVFPLRPLVKGRMKKERKVSRKDLDVEKDRKVNFQNGLIQGINGIDVAVIVSYGGKNVGSEGDASVVTSNGQLEQKREKRSDSVRLTSLKLRQDSKEVGACFVALKSEEVEGFKSMKVLRKSRKAICIQALSPKKFLILDSVGDLHFLRLSSPVHGSEISGHMQKLTQALKIQKLAVSPDPSLRTQNVWISDGHHTIHIMEVSEVEASGGEDDRKKTDEQLIQTSVMQAIFTSEKIQEIVAFAQNAILILAEGSMLAYDIS